MAYGALESLGYGWQAVDAMPEKIQKVTQQDILDAAAAVFDPSRAVLVKLLPEE